MTGYCFQGFGLKTGIMKNRKFKSLMAFKVDVSVFQWIGISLSMDG
jgi:hypothetical protein